MSKKQTEERTTGKSIKQAVKTLSKTQVEVNRATSRLKQAFERTTRPKISAATLVDDPSMTITPEKLADLRKWFEKINKQSTDAAKIQTLIAAQAEINRAIVLVNARRDDAGILDTSTAAFVRHIHEAIRHLFAAAEGDPCRF